MRRMACEEDGLLRGLGGYLEAVLGKKRGNGEGGKEREERRCTTKVSITYITGKPLNMAMKRPHARIICVVLQHHIPGRF